MNSYRPMRVVTQRESQNRSYEAEATPEQIRDDGSIDGVPVLTKQDIENRRHQRMAEVAKLENGMKYGRR